MIKTAIITTLHHNVGDDFVREGILFLLRPFLENQKVALIHKHLPITARPGFEWVHDSLPDRWIRRWKPGSTLRITRLLDKLPLDPATDKVLQCDVLVQSGAPIYWLNRGSDSSNTEWWHPLIERRWLSRQNPGVFLNLAGGTCQSFESDGQEIIRNVPLMDHIRKFFDVADLTTVRDDLSATILRAAGREPHLLPCTSLFAVDQLGIAPAGGEFIALNYMRGGGHYDFAENIDADKWEEVFVQFARKLSRSFPCKLVCHNAAELSSATRLLPEIPRLYSTDPAQILRFYGRARFGIVNRVHGAFALASLGKPAAVVGADTRAAMATKIFAPFTFVNVADAAWLEKQAGALDSAVGKMPALIAALKRQTLARYQELLRPVLSRFVFSNT